MTDLQELRKEIDQIDSQMVALYEKRAKIVEDVARYKIETGKPVLDPQREQALLEKLGEKTHSDFNCRSIREVYQQIMSISRRRQYQLLQEHGKSPDLGFTQAEALNRDHVTVVFQGVEGAYSYAAMNAFLEKTSKAFMWIPGRTLWKPSAPKRRIMPCFPLKTPLPGSYRTIMTC